MCSADTRVVAFRQQRSTSRNVLPADPAGSPLLWVRSPEVRGRRGRWRLLAQFAQGVGVADVVQLSMLITKLLAVVSWGAPPGAGAACVVMAMRRRGGSGGRLLEAPVVRDANEQPGAHL